MPSTPAQIQLVADAEPQDVDAKPKQKRTTPTMATAAIDAVMKNGGVVDKLVIDGGKVEVRFITADRGPHSQTKGQLEPWD